MTNLEIINLTKKLNKYLFQPPVILCIGSSRVSGDSLGPATGEILTKIFQARAFVYGTLTRPVNAVNLRSTLAFISRFHKNAPVLAIDAGVGKGEIGRICVKNEGIYPGAADGKILPYVGDVSITAAVCQSITEIDKVNKNFVVALSYGIAKAVCETEMLKSKNIKTESCVPLSQFDGFSNSLPCMIP